MQLVSLALLAAVLTPLAPAQVVFSTGMPLQPSSSAPGATISGNILCGDSNTPARLARILLKPAVIDDSAVDAMIESQQKAQAQARARNPNANAPAPRQPSAQQQAVMRTAYTRQLNMQSERSNSTTADFNGHYVLTGVAPGTYYVHAEMPGYVDPLDQFSFDELTSPDPETAKRIAQLAPRITVLGTEEQRADIRLERGASITGHVLFDDGSPAPGWLVAALPQSKLQLKPGDPNSAPAIVNMGGIGINGQPPRTDDLGNFRITGLAAGDYVLRAMLNSPAPGSKGLGGAASINLILYSGDTFHMGEAKAFSLTSGQTRNGTDITVPLNKMHSIRGSVVAKSDGHSPNNGNAQLSTKADPNFHAFTNLLPDGSFTFYSIPAGDYTLNIGGASDTRPATTSTPNGGTRTTMERSRTYGPAQTTVTVNDVDLTGITLTVPDPGERSTPAAN